MTRIGTSIDDDPGPTYNANAFALAPEKETCSKPENAFVDTISKLRTVGVRTRGCRLTGLS